VSRVRVVIADQQAIDRGGLVQLVRGERDLTVVGEAATVNEAIQQCRALQPDVLVLSLTLPAQEQRAAIPAIRAELPELKILAISERGEATCLALNPPGRSGKKPAEDDPHRVCSDCLQMAVRQGAMATLRRSADPDELFRAIRSVAGGRASYDPATSARIMAASGPNGATSRSARLSAREREVALLIAEGKSNKEISTALNISEPTVKKHVGHILQKLDVDDRLQAGLFLARNPLILQD
jgi:DNA-binding NarL/FixJ family response regulator